MSTQEFGGPFVNQGPLAVRNGRRFAAWKKPGEQRNTLFELKAEGPLALGYTPGVFYKDGECALAFDDLTGELLMLNFCSPNPATGGDARPVLWETGIVIPAPPVTDQGTRNGLIGMAVYLTKFAELIKVACDALIKGIAPLVPK